MSVSDAVTLKKVADAVMIVLGSGVFQDNKKKTQKSFLQQKLFILTKNFPTFQGLIHKIKIHKKIITEIIDKEFEYIYIYIKRAKNTKIFQQ